MEDISELQLNRWYANADLLKELLATLGDASEKIAQDDYNGDVNEDFSFINKEFEEISMPSLKLTHKIRCRFNLEGDKTFCDCEKHNL